MYVILNTDGWVIDLNLFRNKEYETYKRPESAVAGFKNHKAYEPSKKYEVYLPGQNLPMQFDEMPSSFKSRLDIL